MNKDNKKLLATRMLGNQYAVGFGRPEGSKQSAAAKEKIRRARIGKKWSRETRERFLKARTGFRVPKSQGELNAEWKGNDVGYRGLHRWVQRWLGVPMTCEGCRKSNLKGRAIHWANKSGLYKRDLGDWLRLCAKCHFSYDNAKPL